MFGDQSGEFVCDYWDVKLLLSDQKLNSETANRFLSYHLVFVNFLIHFFYLFLMKYVCVHLFMYVFFDSSV